MAADLVELMLFKTATDATGKSAKTKFIETFVRAISTPPGKRCGIAAIDRRPHLTAGL